MQSFATHPRSLMLALLLSLLAGCGGGSDPVVPKAFTEHDFAANPSLRLEVGSVGVTFLEPKDAVSATSDDTGLPSTDEFPLRISEPTATTYTIDSADDTIAMVKLIRLSGNVELFVINASQPSATVTLDPGDYKLVVYSGYTMAEASGMANRAVFLESSRPTPTQAAMTASLPHKSVLAAAGATQLLVSSRQCIGCDLSGTNLSGANLSGGDMSGANLSSANLIGVNLYGANLGNADGRVP